MNKPEFLTLLDLWLEGKATPQEEQLIVRWYESFEESQIDEALLDEKVAEGLKRLMERIRPVKVRRMVWPRWVAAAAVVIIVAGAGYWYYEKGKTNEPLAPIAKTDIQPGHAGAVLHLKNRTIATDTLKDGLVAIENGVKIVKENGMIRYEGVSDEITMHEFTTDKKRTDQIELPDGSKLWLNAASSIRYPSAFTGGARVVEMTGECYFEVKHNAAMPFKVKVNGQIIEDIGTAFNVNAYSDEPALRATLAEGAIKIADKTLKPGQQYYKGEISEANVEEALAWKNGLFSFGNTVDLQQALRQLARWYDVEIVYENGKVPQRSFGGKIGRNLTLDAVLEILKEQKVNARIENKKLIVGD